MGSAAVKHAVGHDPTIYPVVEKMGESSLHRFIVELLRPLLANVLAERGVKAFVGADQFIYYVQHAPTYCVAPDVYVMPGIDAGIDVGCWKTWEHGVVPSFALEVVSLNNPRKDTVQSPVRHADLGTKELVIFDPHHAGRRDASHRVAPPNPPSRWLVFRRVPRRGLIQVQASTADRVYSKTLRLWLRATGEGDDTRIRLAEGPEGDDLIPTPEERERAALAEIARLRAEIERLRR